MKENTKLKATKEIGVFIDKKWYNEEIKFTEVGKIPLERRERLNWKGCYYTIKPNEFLFFDRTNNWDRSYFKLENGAEFLVECGNPESFIEDNNIIIVDNF